MLESNPPSRNRKPHRASFRDPSGFLFTRDAVIYRQVNRCFRSDYDHLIQSGLYESLAGSGLLVRHEEDASQPAFQNQAYKIIRPQLIPFISYPFEWCFSQLREAALTTLRIQTEALRFGMTLKDATGYNIQFVGTRPIFVDTLSFERYREGSPWNAYRQFCQHFLAPLALMSYRDHRLGQLLRVHLDGVPLDLASALLPSRTWLRFGLASHIHLHARTQRHFEGRRVSQHRPRLSLNGLRGLLASLESALEGLKRPEAHSNWAQYYGTEASYSAEGLVHKKEIVEQYLEQIGPKTVWDLGANTGLFSRLAASRGCYTISFDSDPMCVEHGYREAARDEPSRILPLWADLTNPSPGLGWENRERMTLRERGPADLVLALALVHHLAIGNNLPLLKIACFLAQMSEHLVIEFVPKEDPQTQRLFSAREDIFPEYTREGFESAFRNYFRVCASTPIRDSGRILYRMERASNSDETA